MAAFAHLRTCNNYLSGTAISSFAASTNALGGYLVSYRLSIIGEVLDNYARYCCNSRR